MPASSRDVIPEFGLLVQQAREKAGLSRAELATKVGLRNGTSTIRMIEVAERSPSLRMAARLADALSLRVYLHTLAPKMLPKI